MLRIVADANIYISAAISPHGPAMRIMEHAQSGEVTLLMSDTLCDELTDVLARDKFRRWLTEQEADEFVDAVVLLAEWVDDRPAHEIPQLCDDPDDNYLVALYQDADANLLVTGDRAVKRISYPGVHLYTPADALKTIAFRHEWGEGFIPGDPTWSERDIEAEGSRALLNVYSAFSAIFEQATSQAEAEYLLAFVAVPSAVAPFMEAFDETRSAIKDRGLGTRPEFASPDVAYLKLPPDPKVHLLAAGPVYLPPDTIWATLQRCPDLPDPPELATDHWRVFGIGRWPLEQIPPRIS